MITKLENPSGINANAELRLKFDNGDLIALRDIVKKFGFVDDQAAIRFALVVLLKTDSDGVYVTRNSDRVFVSPDPGILKGKKKVAGAE